MPPNDYSDRSARSIDTSAGVITAAGLLRLAAACRGQPRTWRHRPRWRALGRRMLAASLGYVRDRPPLGYFGGQCSPPWSDHGELVFGLYYALEARRLARR